MSKNSKLPWILTGYSLFSKEGAASLKIEVLARKVNINKSSFYHHFADLEIFIEQLLEYHIERAKIIAAKERECKTMIPDLLNVLVEYKEDLLFSRQLRINRNNILFKECYEKSNQIVGDSILGIWAEELGLKDNSGLANLVLKLTLDNFYLQINEETFTYEWLLDFVDEFKLMVDGFTNNEKRKAFLNGSV